MDYLNLGTIIKTHGLDGTLVIASNTYFGDLRYQEGVELFLISPNNKEEVKVTVESYRFFKETDFVKFKEIDTIEKAQLYKGYSVNIKKEEAEIPEGYYLFSDLEQCDIYTDENKYLGKVIKVEEFPAQITLRCKTNDNKEFFVPFIDEVFIKEVNLDENKIIIKYMDGMIE